MRTQPSTSALYEGRVWHHRLKPRDHRLGYAAAMTLLDLDDLEALSGSLRLFSIGRLNLMDFRAADHLDGAAQGLKSAVDEILREAGLVTGGRVRLLCMPRTLGAVFNPLSVYFCCAPGGRLQAILYEVNNTFGQRHSYLLPVEGGQSPVRHSCQKTFYVSPFNTLEMRYDFTVSPPGLLEDQAPLSVRIDVLDADGLLMTAAFSGSRRPLTDPVILRTWLRHPLPALTVITAIHWEALKLWFKGVALKQRPSPPLRPVSIGASPSPLAASDADG